MKAIIYTMAIMSLLAIAGFFLIAVFPIIIGHVIVKYTFIEPTDPGEPLEFAIIGLLAILGTFSIFVIAMATIDERRTFDRVMQTWRQIRDGQPRQPITPPGRQPETKDGPPQQEEIPDEQEDQERPGVVESEDFDTVGEAAGATAHAVGVGPA
ncbi:hypothetical protein LCGC14_2801330 [marine sediment metagenome]|uniref:Uncharacterized protein n=1 Tax=marine sediment metagenome TaxID=412755 RepID=A0A0F9BDZ9_9ZZZZ